MPHGLSSDTCTLAVTNHCEAHFYTRAHIHSAPTAMDSAGFCCRENVNLHAGLQCLSVILCFGAHFVINVGEVETGAHSVRSHCCKHHVARVCLAEAVDWPEFCFPPMAQMAFGRSRTLRPGTLTTSEQRTMPSRTIRVTSARPVIAKCHATAANVPS